MNITNVGTENDLRRDALLDPCQGLWVDWGRTKKIRAIELMRVVLVRRSARILPFQLLDRFP